MLWKCLGSPDPKPGFTGIPSSSTNSMADAGVKRRWFVLEKKVTKRSWALINYEFGVVLTPYLG